VSPTVAKLNALPHPRYGTNVVWPAGTPQPYSKAIAQHLFSLIATCETSFNTLLHNHPELPPFAQLDSWRSTNKHGFAEGWRKAREAQAHYLANKCLDLAKSITPKTAHVARVQFDIYRWFAGRMHPNVFGDKPIPTPQTTVNVGIAISPERLTEIRSKLDATRSALAERGHNRRLTSKQVGQPNGAPSPTQNKDNKEEH
jgi:hypothetical protein